MSDTRIHFPRHIPFVETLGLELWAFGDGQAELRLSVEPGVTNSHGVAHGGLQMTMLDVAMAHAARSAFAAGEDPGCITIEMKTSFMCSARGRLTARGKVLQRTSSMAFTEAGIYDEAGRLCTHATGTFKYVRAPKGAEEIGT